MIYSIHVLLIDVEIKREEEEKEPKTAGEMGIYIASC